MCQELEPPDELMRLAPACTTTQNDDGNIICSIASNGKNCHRLFGEPSVDSSNRTSSHVCVCWSPKWTSSGVSSCVRL